MVEPLRRRNRRAPWAAIALGALVAAGCGGSTLIATANGKKYATTPVSAGPLNLKALPFGDGYVSSTPKLGYVDSCITHFGAGGASVNGPWINSSAKTWNYRAKVAVNGTEKW